jgi:hypothetical protein
MHENSNHGHQKMSSPPSDEEKCMAEEKHKQQPNKRKIEIDCVFLLLLCVTVEPDDYLFAYSANHGTYCITHLHTVPETDQPIYLFAHLRSVLLIIVRTKGASTQDDNNNHRRAIKQSNTIHNHGGHKEKQ